MPKIKSDPDTKTVSTPAKKDTIKWCKGIVGREHAKVWRQRQEHWLSDWQELVCTNCNKRFDNRWPCYKCGQFKCDGHDNSLPRQRRKYPRPMSSDFRKPKSYVKHK